MADIFITKYKEYPVVSAYIDDRLEFLSVVHDTKLDNIFLCRVENVVRNIDAVFVRYEKEMSGYVSLKDILPSNVVNRKIGSASDLRQGDEIILQLETEELKTKKARLSSFLSIPGKYCVLTLGRRGVGASKKLSDSERSELTGLLREPYNHILEDNREALYGSDFGVIVRTEAASLPEDARLDLILEDLKKSLSKLCLVMSEGRKRTLFTCLYNAASAELSSHISKAEAFLRSRGITDYETKYESVIYSIADDIERCLRQKVWLKSGAYIIIEQLESFNAIDVNTGKAITGKKDIISKINMEAADEIMRQIRLRNLSGMILIDFINMKNSDDNDALCQYVKNLASKGPVHTEFIDITGLGIVELTRNKNDRSLKEIILDQNIKIQSSAGPE